jgi:cytochrome c peroxidase
MNGNAGEGLRGRVHLPTRRPAAGIALGAAVSMGCGGASPPLRAAPAAPAALTDQAALGRLLFEDVSLSASGRQSCATCHAPATAHGAPDAAPVRPGGPALERSGTRSSPSIRYLSTNGPFHFDAEGTPVGGFFWDGRAGSLADQAGRPFLNPVEMANPDRAAVVAKLRAAPYAGRFRAVFGAAALDDVEGAYLRMTLAIQRFELEAPELHPFDSKYDAFLRGEVVLSPQELHGLALFNSPAKGNCAACHPSARGADGSPPLFTDFTYDALGVPRNPEIPANADPSSFDLGLCAREGGDLAGRPDLCGAFKVPSLRNVAQRRSFFHNGRFTTLKDTLAFYVRRDTNPERYYPTGDDGAPVKFDDLPPQYRRNVNTTEAPYDRRPGDAPALDGDDIDDVIAFLRTLDDGWVPPAR